MSMDIVELLEASRPIWAATKDVEKVLSFVRSHGGNKNDCITVLRRLDAVAKSEAKRVVHFSETWRDHLAADERLHAELEAAANKQK